MMDFINDITTESAFELIKRYYRAEQGKEIQIGSEEFAMASMIAYICGVLVQKFNSQSRQRYLSTATGKYLDALGETFDIGRPEPTHAVCRVTVTSAGGLSYDISAPAGTFIISDPNGVKFANLADISIPASGSSQTLTFIGIEDRDNVLAENNLDIGSVTTILTPVAGISGARNTTVPVGASDSFPDTEVGDEAYRQYIIRKRSGMSTGGPAPAYEVRALETSTEVLDAYCKRYDDEGWEDGVAKVYILVRPSLTQEQRAAVIDSVQARLNAPEWKPVCDTVSVQGSSFVDHIILIRVGLRAKYAIAGKVKVQKDIDAYVKLLNTRLGHGFSISELARMCQTPDEKGVCSEYVYCDDMSDNYLSVKKWEHGEFLLEVDDYEIIPD